MSDQQATFDALIARGTFKSILDALKLMDDGLVKFDPKKHADALLKSEVKIDSIRYMIKKYESRIKEVAADIKELQTEKSVLTNSMESLEWITMQVIEKNDSNQWPGIKYVGKIKETKRVDLLVEEPTSDEALAFPDLVKRTYKWDKIAFNEQFNKNPESLAGYAVRGITKSLTFAINRSGLDD